MNSNQLTDLRIPLADGMQGKNYVFDDCMALLMERLGEPRLDYWTFSWLTGDGLTQIYNAKQTTAREYCVSGYRIGTDFLAEIFGTIGYGYTYVTAEQINADKAQTIQKIKGYIDKGVSVLALNKLNEREYCGFSLYIGYEDDGKTLLFITDCDRVCKFDMAGEIKQDLVFIGDKCREIDYDDLVLGALKKMPIWLALPEENSVFYGAAAFRAWADDVENDRFDSEPDLWANYGAYFCNMATNSWANNVCDAPHASLLHKAAQINPQYAELRDKVAALFHKIGNGDGAGGLWKECEDLGGGFNLNNETFRDKEKKTQIAVKLREAAVIMDEIARLLTENLAAQSLTC